LVIIENYRKFTNELKELEVKKRVENPKFSYRMMFITKPKYNGTQELCFAIAISAIHKSEITEAFMRYHPEAVIKS
jgi:hypothetical protein